MPSALSTLNDRLDLEKKFALWFFVLVAMSCMAFFVLEAHRSGVVTAWVAIACVSVLASLAAHYAFFKPIRQIMAMAKAIGTGDFSKRLGFARRDDIGDLGREMDQVCEQLLAAHAATDAHVSALEQLRQSDRIATLGRLASSVAHELGNPLNVVELRAQLISSGDVSTLQGAQHSAAVILEQTKRMTRIIGEILSFARAQPPKLTRVDFVALVHKAIALSSYAAKQHKTNIVFEPPTGGIDGDGDADKVLQILVNLMMNGAHAMPTGGTLEVGLYTDRHVPIDDPYGEQRDFVCIQVKDHGIGIPVESLPKIFEPFFSTKTESGGTGLGLSVAQGIAREHDGFISVTSELGRGSCFVVHLPKHAATGQA